MLKWKKGRQKTGYYKLKIFESKLLKFDMYLIKYQEGSYIPLHTDPVKNYNHNRINVVLKHAKVGGEFVLFNEHHISFTKKRLVKFRPDHQLHGVWKIKEGTRYVLSIGWLSK